MTALLAPPPGKQTQGRPQLRPVPGTRRRMATVPFVLVVAVVLGLGMVALLVLTTTLGEQAFAVQTRQREANALSIRMSALQADVADARSIQSLSVAAQKLGMRPNPYGAQLRLDGTVIGKPRVVLGGEVPTVRYLTPEQAAAQVAALDRAEAERKAKAVAAAKARAEERARAKAEAEATKKAQEAEAKAKADAAAAEEAAKKAAKKGKRP